MSASRILTGDCLSILPTLPDHSVNCCVTSPPYFGLRDYGHDGQIGLESTPDEYVSKMVQVFREVRRVLRDDGTLWLNLGDSYAAQRGGSPMPAETLAGGISGHGDKVAKRGRESAYLPHRNAASLGLKHKDLIGIPWRVAFALQADGWYLRQDIIWHKPNPMPESVTDRCTKAHEYIFLLSKSERYYYDADAVKEESVGEWNSKKGFGGDVKKSAGDPKLRTQGHGTFHSDEIQTGRNRRSVWTVNTKPFGGAHFATFPTELILPCVLAGCPAGGTVLDPFNGAGTSGLVALSNGRNYVGIELNPEYVALSMERMGVLSSLIEVTA
jgi:site-specific DNA-methyltransferase (adenine-specific)